MVIIMIVLSATVPMGYVFGHQAKATARYLSTTKINDWHVDCYLTSIN